MSTEGTTTPVPATPATPPPPSAHYRSARTVGIVMVAILIAGAIGGILGGGKNDQKAPDRDPSELVEENPSQVKPPEKVDLPGPQPGGKQGSGPGNSVRVVTATGNLGDASQDAPPVTIGDPGSEETTTTEAGPDETTTTLGEDESTTTTTPGNDQGDQGSGGIAYLPGPAAVLFPTSWNISKTDEGYIRASTPGAVVYIGVYNTDDTITADDLLAHERQAQAKGITDLEVGEVTPVASTRPHIRGISAQAWAGILPSQNGSVAAEGDFVAIAADRGYGYTVTTFTQRGNYDAFAEDFKLVFSSLITTVGGKASE
jgi:hypothetical protein